MKDELKLAFDAEMAISERLIRSGRLERAMRHLETAHVLGQNHVLPHVQTHWSMLRIALKRHSLADCYGQVIRIVLGSMGSAVGIVPIGNTGGSDVSMFARMPITPRMAALIEDRASQKE